MALPLGAALAGLGVLLLAVSLTPLTNNDIWLHMANGRWILEHGRVPLTDPYSFSAEGNRFYAHEWLAGVLFEIIYRLGDVSALIVAKTILGALALGLAMLAARREGGRWTSVIGCAGLALVIVNSRFLERPEMFSYALTGLYLVILSAEHRRLRDPPTAPAARGEPDREVRRRAPGRLRLLLGSSLLWWLVPAHWVWVQLHGYFLTGLAMVALFLLAEAIPLLPSLRRPPSPPRPVGGSTPRLRLASGAAALTAMGLLGILNPNGVEIYTFPFELAGGSNIFMQTIFEWRPTFTTAVMTDSSMFLALCWWLALLTVGCLDSATLLARAALWRAVGIISLLFLVLLHPATAPAGLPASLLLTDSPWLRSPADLMATLLKSPGIRDLCGPLFWPLGSWGTYGLLLLALLGGLLASWRRPAVAGLIAAAAALSFVFRGAGTLALALLPAPHGPLGDAARSWLVENGAGCILALILGPSLLFATLRGSLPAWQAALTAAFIALAVRQNRNIVNLTLVTLPVLAPALTRLRTAIPDSTVARRRSGAPGPARRSLPAVSLALLAAVYFAVTGLTVAAGWPYTPTVTKRCGLGVGPRVPVGAVDYIRRNGIRGRVFNKYSYGAYLIHELYPDSRVYMDSRNDVYGPELYRTYLRVLQERGQAERVFAENQFDYVLVDYEPFPGRSGDEGLFTYLAGHPEWVLVFFDDTSVLYLPARPSNAAIIGRDGYRALDPVRYRPGTMARLSSVEAEEFDRESERAVSRQPGSVTARLLRVESLAVGRRDAEALQILEGVLVDDPSHLYALMTAANLAKRMGDTGRARALYQRALGLDPSLEEARRQLELVGRAASE